MVGKSAWTVKVKALWSRMVLPKLLGDGNRWVRVEDFTRHGMRQQQHFCKRIRKGSNKLRFSVETEAIARPLLNEHNIEVGGGLGEIAGKVWRVGLMGHNSRLESVDRLVVALNQVKVRTVSDR